MSHFLVLLEAFLKYHTTKVGSIISARVVSVGSAAVTLESGMKAEATVPIEEFQGTDGKVRVRPGDLVPAFVSDDGTKDGDVVLSLRKAKKAVAWRMLERCLRVRAKIEGKMVGRVKGGMTVTINGLKAFLPGSLIDIRPVRNPEGREGKVAQFHILKLDSSRSNIVLSRRSVLERERLANRRRLLACLRDGEVLRGKVKNITDYGAFIDLGGLDGLLHITDISWKRIKHPSNVLSIGDSIAVKVLKFDRTKKKVSLGLKQLHADPWDDVIERFPPGRKVRGKVTNITDYGAFVEIEPGIEGLVHISEMYWKNKTALPQRSLRVGQFVSVSIIDISKTRRRISLGMKQCLLNSWLAFSKVFRRNDKLAVTVRSLARLGIFVNLPMSLRGLLYLPRPLRRSVPQFHTKGEVVEASIVNVNTNRKHISLISDDILTNRFHNSLRSNILNVGLATALSSFPNSKLLVTKGPEFGTFQPDVRHLVLSSVRRERSINILSVGGGCLVSSTKETSEKGPAAQSNQSHQW